MDRRDIIQVQASLNNLKDNLGMKKLAKEILLEENYEKFMKSYKFTYWFQLLGTIAGFIIPSIVLIIIFDDIEMVMFGILIGIFWMIIWLVISHFVSQSKIYHEFAKWYRKKDVSIRDLDDIFY